MFKNFFLKTLVKLFQGKKGGNPEHFLVVSTTGLGDTLWATPAIKALREKHPHAYIAVLTTKLGKDVLSLNPHIDEIFLTKNFFSLKQKKFHTIYIFHTSQRLILPLCALLGSTEIIGTEGINKGLDDLLTQKIPQKYQHEVTRRCEIASVKTDGGLEFFIDQKTQDQINSFLAKHTGPFIGIHPGAKDKFKQWDPECFVKVGNMLRKKLGCNIFITGNEKEKLLAESIASQIEGAISLAGQFGLKATAALISKFSVMLANDTGPMHLAFAVNTPTVALFAPTDPHLCGPLPSAKAIVIDKAKTCRACLKKKCQEPFCLLQISPEEVYSAIIKLLLDEEKSGHARGHGHGYEREDKVFLGAK